MNKIIIKTGLIVILLIATVMMASALITLKGGTSEILGVLANPSTSLGENTTIAQTIEWLNFSANTTYNNTMVNITFPAGFVVNDSLNGNGSGYIYYSGGINGSNITISATSLIITFVNSTSKANITTNGTQFWINMSVGSPGAITSINTSIGNHSIIIGGNASDSLDQNPEGLPSDPYWDATNTTYLKVFNMNKVTVALDAPTTSVISGTNYTYNFTITNPAENLNISNVSIVFPTGFTFSNSSSDVSNSSSGSSTTNTTGRVNITDVDISAGNSLTVNISNVTTTQTSGTHTFNVYITNTTDDSGTWRSVYSQVAQITVTVAPTGGSGGSTGGAGVSTSESFDNIEKAERHDKTLFADRPATYTFTATEHGVSEIVVTGEVTESNIALRVEALKGTSTSVSASAPGAVYKNINVWAGTTNIKEALIRFKVENSWLGSNNIAPGKVKMVRWDGGKWVQLDTTQKTKDNSYTYYEAKTGGFSSFAIVGLKEAEAVPTEVKATAKPTVVTTPTGDMTPAPEAMEDKESPGFGAVAFISAMVLMVAIRNKERR